MLNKDGGLLLIQPSSASKGIDVAIGADTYCRDAAVAVGTARASCRASTTSCGGGMISAN
jgi:hypothetical protein